MSSTEWWVYAQGEVTHRNGLFTSSTDERPPRWYGPFAQRSNAEQCAVAAAKGRPGIRILERKVGWKP